MQALLQQYKDEICDLKYKNSCLALEINALEVELKEIKNRASIELDKRDKIINQLEELVHNATVGHENELNKMIKDKMEGSRQQEAAQEELIKSKSQLKKILFEVTEQLAMALNVKGKELSGLIARAKQQRIEHDMLLVEQHNRMLLMQQKDSALQTESRKRQQAEERLRELENELSTMQADNRQKQENRRLTQQLQQLERESKTTKLNSQKLQADYEKSKQLLQQKAVEYDQEVTDLTNKLSQMQTQVQELKSQLQGMESSSRQAEIEQDFEMLLSRIRVKKEVKIKNMLSEKLRKFDVNTRGHTPFDSSVIQY